MAIILDNVDGENRYVLCALVFHDREIHAVLCDVYNVSLLFLFFISLIFSVFSYGFHNALGGDISSG